MDSSTFVLLSDSVRVLTENQPREKPTTTVMQTKMQIVPISFRINLSFDSTKHNIHQNRTNLHPPTKTFSVA
jgi:hypothetical protein